MTGMRRRSVVAGVAGAAVVAGAGVALWRTRASGVAPDTLPPADDQALWSLRLERPAGGELVLAELRGRPLVVNFWATWCAPCVKEMPELDRFHRAYAPRGWQVLGIAIDRLEPVKEFLGRIPVGFPIVLAGLPGMAVLRQLGNPSGALPFTVQFDAEGRVRRRKLGETHAAELERWAAD
jgi:thiol-disulfide isomerase/thioredoxin